MRTWLASSVCKGPAKFVIATLAMFLLHASAAFAQPSEAGGEASLKVPDLSTVNFLGMNGHSILVIGIFFCFLGLLFGLGIYMQLKKLPVHRANRSAEDAIDRDPKGRRFPVHGAAAADHQVRVPDQVQPV